MSKKRLVPVKTKWKIQYGRQIILICPVCGYETTVYRTQMYNYCSCCGTKMYNDPDEIYNFPPNRSDTE